MHSCAICSSTTTTILFSLGNIPLCDNYCESKDQALAQKLYPIDVVYCENCGHAELAYKAPESEIYFDYIYRTSESPGLKKHFQDYAHDVSNFYLTCQFGGHKSSLLKSLDIGGNDGLLASYLNLQGFSSYVLDPSPSIAFCNSSVTPIRGYLNYETSSQLSSKHGTFQLITANNVIANVRDLHEFFNCISNLLNPHNGLLVLESGYLPLMLDNNVVEMFNHEHYHYFTCSSLSYILNKYGMKIVSFQPIASKGGSFRCIAALDSCSVDSQAAFDCNDAVSIVEKSQSLVVNLNRYKEIVATLSDPLVGFGAYAGGTILTYALDIQDRLSYLIDDNTSRHGLFSPHIGLKIQSPSILLSIPDASIIVLAWRFKQQIADKHSSLFNQCQEHLYLFDA